MLIFDLPDIAFDALKFRISHQKIISNLINSKPVSKRDRKAGNSKISVQILQKKINVDLLDEIDRGKEILEKSSSIWILGKT